MYQIPHSTPIANLIKTKALPSVMVSRVSCYMRLSLNINANTGLEFYCKFVLIDGEFFNQPLDKCLAIFGQSGWLFPKECGHVGNPFLQVIPSGTFQLKLLLLLAKTVNFIANFLIVGLRCQGYGVVDNDASFSI